MRTRTLALLAAGALGIGLAAGALAQAKTKLTYAGWFALYQHMVPAANLAEQAFEKRHPNVDWIRNDVPFDQALNQATVSTLAGNAADNIHLIAGWVPALWEIGGLEPLNDHFTKDEWAQIPEASLASVTFDGKIAAMPWVPAPILLFHNRNLMREAGLDPDRPAASWAELKEQIMKICALPGRDGAKVYGIALRTQRNPNSAQWTIPIIYGHGGDIVGSDGKVRFNTPEVRAAFKWIQDVVTSGCSPAGFSIGETRNTMAQGRAGFVFEGPWGKGLFRDLSGGKMTTAADGDVWVAPMPAAPDGSRRTIGNPHVITISAKSPEKKLAADLIRYVIFDPDFTQLYFESSAQQISTSALPLLKGGVMGKEPYAQVFVEELANTIDNPIKSAKFYAIMDEVAPALQAIIQGGSIEQELAAADRKIERLLRR